MKKCLLFCFSIWSISLSAQAWLQHAQALSDSADFEASNTILRNFISTHAERLYDASQAWYLLSYNYLRTGDYPAALHANDQSQDLRQQLQTGEEEENYMRAGAIYLQMGDYERALEDLFAAKQLPIENPLVFALLDGYIASAYLELGKWGKAEHHYRQSIETLKVEVGEDHPDVAANYYNLGRVYWAIGQENDALEQWQNALPLAKALPRSDLAGQIYNAMGEFWRRKSPDKAMPFYQEALNDLTSVFGKHHPEVARTLLNIARLEIQLGHIETAEEYLLKAKSGLCPALPALGGEVPQSVYCMDRTLMATALILQGRIALSKFNTTEDTLQLKKALSFGEQAVNFAEDQLNTLVGDATRFRLLDSSQHCYALAVEAAMLLYERTGNIQYAKKSFQLAERGKAFVLRANMAALGADKPVNGLLDQREAQLKRAVRHWEVQLEVQPDRGDWLAQLLESKKRLYTFIDSLKANAPDYYRVQWAMPTPEADELQTQLDDKTAVLSYFIGGDDYFLFVITNEEFAAERLASDFAGIKNPKVSKFLNLMTETGPAATTGTGVYSKLNTNRGLPTIQAAVTGYLEAIRKINGPDFLFYANNLYAKLILPVQKQLKGRKNLVILPHGVLCQMPFEAILRTVPEEQETIKYAKLDYLVNSYAVQYCFSAATYLEGEKQAMPKGTDFLGMAPIFDPDGNIGIVWNTNVYIFDTTYQTDLGLRSAITEDGRQFKTLPYSEEEIDGIAKRFGAKKRIGQIYLGNVATEAQFKQQAGKYAFLHLATHSFVNETNPALSGIVFAQPQQQEAEDGILYAGEIMALDLHGSSVVLSSCQSGAGKLVNGEGLLSLARVFFEADAHSVTASLWKVDDLQTSVLMSAFYDGILSSKDTAEALRQAKLKLIKSKNGFLPFYWSSFVLMSKK